jgi:bifunctional DNA-binding transcriptional regulator/antitoxin component of YhaV-PrlF toxin-antitoxin module
MRKPKPPDKRAKPSTPNNAPEPKASKQKSSKPIASEPKPSRKKSAPKTLDKMLYGTATVGQAWQIVIPRKACKDFGIKPRDIVLVFAHPQTKGLLVCKADALEHVVREMKAALRVTKKDSASTKTKSSRRRRSRT